MIGLLIAVLVVCIVLWAAQSLMAAFGVPDPIRTVMLVVIVLVALLWFLNAAGIALPGLGHGLR